MGNRVLASDFIPGQLFFPLDDQRYQTRAFQCFLHKKRNCSREIASWSMDLLSEFEAADGYV